MATADRSSQRCNTVGSHAQHQIFFADKLPENYGTRQCSFGGNFCERYTFSALALSQSSSCVQDRGTRFATFVKHHFRFDVLQGTLGKTSRMTCAPYQT